MLTDHLKSKNNYKIIHVGAVPKIPLSKKRPSTYDQFLDLVAIINADEVVLHFQDQFLSIGEAKIQLKKIFK